MSNYSGIIKASMCVVYTIFISIYTNLSKGNNLWLIGILITFSMALLDAYYLAIEKIYIDKFNTFVEKMRNNTLKTDDVYDMTPRTTKLKEEVLSRTITSMKSFSIYGYYGLYIVISIILKYIELGGQHV